MVRLEEVSPTYADARGQVSIPIWCDWKWVRLIQGESKKKFQFLYGAIGRNRLDISDSRANWFQFLYGAIGRGLNLGTAPLNDPGFNSYMVRLEARFRRGNYLLRNSFNSYMVRLEVPWQGQFHGVGLVSIPIWCDWKGSWKSF